jgi:hypothetical protein
MPEWEIVDSVPEEDLAVALLPTMRKNGIRMLRMSIHQFGKQNTWQKNRIVVRIMSCLFVFHSSSCFILDVLWKLFYHRRRLFYLWWSGRNWSRAKFCRTPSRKLKIIVNKEMGCAYANRYEVVNRILQDIFGAKDLIWGRKTGRQFDKLRMVLL